MVTNCEASFLFLFLDNSQKYLTNKNLLITLKIRKRGPKMTNTQASLNLLLKEGSH